MNKALVLGAAVSGNPAARLLSRLGVEADIYDRRPDPLALLREDGYGVHSGEWNARHLREVDLVVTSPGVPEHAAPIQDALAAGIPVWSEIELGARNLAVPIVAVTGTNGKTTVTRLVTEMLTASGLAAASAGNIGDPLTGLVLAGMDETVHWDVVVVEASSFQLRFIDEFHPAVAVILNVAPDHLDWHGTFDAYLAAKANIWRNQTGDDVIVFDAADPGAQRAVTGASSRAIEVKGEDPYELDVAAAAAAARAAGATDEGIEAAVARFEPDPHRRTVVGEWGGVTWVDDSKATNPHAAVASAAAYDSVVLIAGGRNKGLDLAPLPHVATVRHTFAIGEAAAELAASGGDRVTELSTLEDAVAVRDMTVLWVNLSWSSIVIARLAAAQLVLHW